MSMFLRLDDKYEVVKTMTKIKQCAVVDDDVQSLLWSAKTSLVKFQTFLMIIMLCQDINLRRRSWKHKLQ